MLSVVPLTITVTFRGAPGSKNENHNTAARRDTIQIFAGYIGVRALTVTRFKSS